MFAKKNAEVEASVMQEITDEQLGQVTGGSGLLDAVTSGNLFGVLGTVTGTVSQVLNTTNVSGLQIQVAGVTVSTPALSTNGLL